MPRPGGRPERAANAATAFGQAAFDDDRREQGERVERCADAGDQQQHRENLTAARQRWQIDRRDPKHGHVERVPDRESLDRHVPDRAEQHDRDEKGDREDRSLSPEDVVAARFRHRIQITAPPPDRRRSAGCV